MITDAEIEISIQQHVAKAEAERGAPFTEAERRIFRIGFLYGAMHGSDRAAAMAIEIFSRKAAA